MQTAIRNVQHRQLPAAHADGHLLFRFEAQLNITPVGITPEGLRMANSYEGMVTDGDFDGARVWGTDHLLLRRDGVCVIDAQTMLSQSAQVNVYEHVWGYCLPPEGMQLPPLESLLEPGFEWPDVNFPIVAFSVFRAAAPELDYLNRATARIDGWANFATGGLAIETRLVSHDARVAYPGVAHVDRQQSRAAAN
jgi:hypothetical protein